MNKGDGIIAIKEVHMRSIFLLTGIAAASAVLAAAAPGLSPKSEAKLQRLVAGKVAQPATSCMPYSRNREMTVLDDNTVVFNNGPERVFVAHLSDGCQNIVGPGPYALVTRQTTGTLCHGDIADVVDTMAHINAGSCVFESFVPYVRPRS